MTALDRWGGSWGNSWGPLPTSPDSPAEPAPPSSGTGGEGHPRLEELGLAVAFLDILEQPDTLFASAVISGTSDIELDNDFLLIAAISGEGKT